MKVVFKYAVGSYSGTLDLAVFYPTKNGNASYMRKWVKPKETAQNTVIANATRNLAEIYSGCSAGYLADLATYTSRYNAEHNDGTPFWRPKTSFNIFIMMMYKFAEVNGSGVDLTSITLNDLSSLFTDVTSISNAVNAGYLPSVTGAEDLKVKMS